MNPIARSPEEIKKWKAERRRRSMSDIASNLMASKKMNNTVLERIQPLSPKEIIQGRRMMKMRLKVKQPETVQEE